MGKFNRNNRFDGDSGQRKFGSKRDFGKRSFGGKNDFKPSMFKAVCSECGKDCEVPFKPTGSRPIFCSNCFEKQSGGNSSRPSFRKSNFERFERSDREMFEAVCGKCGNNCEVPFRPTPGKPVFCYNCFEKGGSTGGRNTEHYKEQFEIINAKLEKILEALNIKNNAELVEKKSEKREIKEEKSSTVDKSKKDKKVSAKAKTVSKKKISKKKK